MGKKNKRYNILAEDGYSCKLPSWDLPRKNRLTGTDVLGCGLHFFGENNVCPCGTTWFQHQKERLICFSDELNKERAKKGSPKVTKFLEGCYVNDGQSQEL